MRLVSQLLQRLRQKGLRRALRPLWQRHVFQHWQLVWLDRDPLARVPRQRTRPCPPVRLVQITPSNTDAFARHFPGQLQAMNDLAREGHTGHMYLDEAGDAVAMVWASTRDYHDRHYYGCTFPVQPGEYFQFAGEVERAYFGTGLSTRVQTELWEAMLAKGCTRIVVVVALDNAQAVKMHLHLDYHEQGRITHAYRFFGRWYFSRVTHYSGSRLAHLAPRARRKADSEPAPQLHDTDA
ncbi:MULTISPECIES: GNAT family N-acetyltransferase [Pseudomonas]|jgi:L-amino acid N-acyltransferase YncA|uniref:GNAT family N-acetyltransferase n=1 Tax=Pseudomonas TaxID=286 RepID=UPI0009D3B652|nr:MULTISPECIES: GNAT family N-acetyltransferase [Pseudomonas]MCO7505711.1 N-acetyltransferase [Pseudomonas sp. VE 267-6A]MCO7530547.1 N-acetyltransferase [Pseudomonas sp. 2]MDD1954047.1 N-acetyltransferase [Pseudomonas sp. 8209]MEC6744150.1 GNAT family N-acetyltransferase [Pseudomonas qingdaonensis]OOW03840.1 N-acetyltransferase [Pseudomonas sp. MF6396]